jgi:chromate transporter
VAGAALGLIGIFLPGMLLLVGTLPFWAALRSHAGAQGAMRGINAAVVGILGAALYRPVWTSSIITTGDLSVALIGFVLLTAWRARPLWVVIMGALAGIVLAQTHS